jgi:hypothetical protein
VHTEHDLLADHCPDRLVRDIHIFAAKADHPEIRVPHRRNPPDWLCASAYDLHPGLNLHATKRHGFVLLARIPVVRLTIPRATGWSTLRLGRSRRYDVHRKPGTIPLAYTSQVEHGCTHDGGLCPDHQQHACLGIIEINSPATCSARCVTRMLAEVQPAKLLNVIESALGYSLDRSLRAVDSLDEDVGQRG